MNTAHFKNQISKIKYQIFLILLLTTYYLLLTTSPALAQSQNPQVNPYLNPNTNPDVPKNLHTWTQTVMIEVMSAMSCQLTGIDPTDPKSKCLGVDPKSGNIGFVEGGGGAIGMAGKMIAMLYTPPLHTGDYFRYLASNFGIAKPAQAAGFEGLKPIQSLWIAFRNVVYLLFVIIFVVIGLAIMLRVRIDPRTVMTIQNQIPKIIIGLLLLTFSFAIAGFLIDLMYVVIFLSYEVISGAVKTPGLLDDLNPLVLQDATPFKAASGAGGIIGIAWNAGNAIKDIILDLLNITDGNIIQTFADKLSIAEIVLLTISGLVGGAIGIFSGLAGFVVGPALAVGLYESLKVIPTLIAFLIIFVALLFVLIRLWFVLIMAYVSILLGVVFAPFWIAASLLPGSPIGFGAWLRNMIANLAAFPATIIMFLLAKAFIEGFGSTQTSGQFVPPLIGNPGATDAIGALIGLGIIFMTDDVVRLLRAALRAPTTPLGAVGAAVGTGTGVVGAVPKALFAGAAGGLTYALGQRFVPIVGRLIPGGRRTQQTQP